MRRLLVASLLLISSNNVRAEEQNQQPVHSKQSISAEKSAADADQPKISGLLEFYGSVSSIETKIDSKFGAGSETKNYRPFSLGVGVGGSTGNNRGYLILSSEKLSSFVINDVETNVMNVGFKLTYDRTFKPWLTDFYLSGGLTYFPKQGSHISADSKDFAPTDSYGLEASLGWQSPFGVAFNFGYKAVSKEYTFDSINPNNGVSTNEQASVSSGWVFLSASIGRY